MKYKNVALLISIKILSTFFKKARWHLYFIHFGKYVIFFLKYFLIKEQINLLKASTLSQLGNAFLIIENEAGRKQVG